MQSTSLQEIFAAQRAASSETRAPWRIIAALKSGVDAATDAEKISTAAAVVVSIPENIHGEVGRELLQVIFSNSSSQAFARADYATVVALSKVAEPLASWPKTLPQSVDAIAAIRAASSDLAIWPEVKAAVDALPVQPKTLPAANEQLARVLTLAIKRTLPSATTSSPSVAARVTPSAPRSVAAKPVVALPVGNKSDITSPAGLLATYSKMPAGPVRAAFASMHYNALRKAITEQSTPAATASRPVTPPSVPVAAPVSNLPAFKSNAEIAAYYGTLSGRPRTEFFARYQSELFSEARKKK